MDQDTSAQPAKCGAKTKNGGTCQRDPVPDARRCHYHGGSSPQSLKAAERKRQTREARRALTLFGETPAEHVDPAEALLELIARKHHEVNALREVLQLIADGWDGDDLMRHPYVWGVVKHEQGTGPEGYIDRTTSAAEPSVWWKLLREAEDQLARYTTAALKAGIEERKVRIAEAQAVMMAQVVDRALTRMGITPEQRRQLDPLIAEELRNAAPQ